MNENELKTLRKSLNMTQLELARELGVSRPFLCSVEKGDKELSEAFAMRIKDLFQYLPQNKPLSEKYRIGKNFSKILGTIRDSGITLSELRDEVFKIKGTDLSKMYIGLMEIPLSIKEILENKFNVNIEYLHHGDKVSMFIDGNSSISQKVPYFKGLTLSESIKKIEDEDFNGFELLSNAFNHEITFYIDLQGDNIPSDLARKTIIGLANKEISINTYGRLFLIKLETGEVFLRRIFSSNKQGEIILRKEDPNFGDLSLPIKQIHSKYMVVNATISEYI